METKNKRSIGIASLLLTLCAVLSSFSPRKGGDSFEIYLNNKLVMQQNLHGDKGVRNLTLQQSNYNDQLSIKYSHCGRVGKGRTITIKDGQNKVLKQWRFTDAAGADKTMTCKVKDILDLKKARLPDRQGSATLQLFYSSNELPNGYLLASIITGNNYARVQ